jgi:hypothetical protein
MQVFVLKRELLLVELILPHVPSSFVARSHGLQFGHVDQELRYQSLEAGLVNHDHITE